MYAQHKHTIMRHTPMDKIGLHSAVIKSIRRQNCHSGVPIQT